jgi:N6-L-threonylcarbamoyladenine synthase
VKYKPRSVLLSGGVAANRTLRNKIATMLGESYPKLKYFYPEINCCTDNAAMIAAAAHFHAMADNYTDPITLVPDPNLKLT